MLVRLRDVQAGDREQLFIWRNLPEVSKWMYTDRPISEDEHARWFEAAMVDPSRRYWVIESEGVGVGLVNLAEIDPVNMRCSWAFYLASPTVRGKGVGSIVEFRILEHVFETLGFTRLSCQVLATNTSVIAMHERFGFQREGLLRQYVQRPDGPIDVVLLGQLASEWATHSASVSLQLAQKGLIST